MALIKIIKIQCDVCGSDMSPVNEQVKTRLTVIFTTDQTEGRSCKPYLTNEAIDLCSKCEQIVLQGNMLFGSGAQGFNKYWFKDIK